MSMIHPTAVIDPTAIIENGAVVGPLCVIGSRVHIGAGTVLLNHVTVQCNTLIGIDNRIYPFSVLGGDPQDKKFNGEETNLIIGDRNEIREHVTIHRGTGDGGGVTKIGHDNLLMVSSHVAHDCMLGNELVIANQVMLAGHVTVEDCATLGGGAGINQFSRIGRCSYVGGLARITRDVPPYMIVEGSPAEVRSVNIVAMTRRGYPADQINAMKEAHRKLYRSNGGAQAEKMAEILEEFGNHQPIQRLCKALELSALGKHGRSNEQ